MSNQNKRHIHWESIIDKHPKTIDEMQKFIVKMGLNSISHEDIDKELLQWDLRLLEYTDITDFLDSISIYICIEVINLPGTKPHFELSIYHASDLSLVSYKHAKYETHFPTRKAAQQFAIPAAFSIAETLL